jgi:hypothetical protein
MPSEQLFEKQPHEQRIVTSQDQLMLPARGKQPIKQLMVTSQDQLLPPARDKNSPDTAEAQQLYAVVNKPKYQNFSRI